MLKTISKLIMGNPIGHIFNLNKKKVVWKKVKNLKPGVKIAVENDGKLDWDEVVSIKKVGYEKVYDIEVEGTHNFVGNGILAHNTYITGNIGVGISSPSETLDVGGDIRSTTGSLQVGNSANLAYNRFGTATTGHSLSTNSDLVVSGKMEVDGAAFFDLGVYGGSGGGSLAAFFNGANSLFFGNVGVGVGSTAVTPAAKLSVVGGVGIGATNTGGFGVAAIPNYDLAVQGNVGIGITNPSSQLQLYSNQTASTSWTGFNLDWSPASSYTLTGDLFTIGIGTTVGHANSLFNVKYGGSSLFNVSETQITSANPHQFTAAGDVAMAYDLVFTNQTSSNIKSYAPLTIEAGESFESNDLTLKTYNSGNIILNPASGNLWADGSNVGIGTTAPSQKLDVNGNARIRSIGSAAYSAVVNQTSDGTLTTATSDIRFKKNIETIDNALEKVMNLRGVTYNWKDESNTKRMTGMIAQEVLPVMPELVFQNSTDGYYGLFYGETSGLLIEAIKEQQAIIDIIKSQVGNFAISDVGDVVLSKNIDADTYEVRDSGGNIANSTAVFATEVAANIKSGSITTKDIIVQTSATFLGTLQAGIINAGNITTNGFVAVSVATDNLLVKTGLISPSVKTGVLSPLANETDINIQVGNGSTAGKLNVQDGLGNTVASIDSEGNATFSGEIATNTLNSENTNTNTLTAQKIYTDQIVAKDGKIYDLASGNLGGITREEIEALLAEAEDNQKLLQSASDWNTNTATSSATLANIETANIKNLFVTDSAAANSLSASSYVAVGTDLMIQSKLGENGNFVSTIDTLSAPLSIQSLAMAPVEIMNGLVRIETNGDVTISGNLYIAGRIQGQGLSLADNNQNGDQNNLDSIFNIKDSSGDVVSEISASGSAQFAGVASQKLTIAGASVATASANLAGEIETNASAGHAIITKGTEQVTIKSPAITDKTLVYVTPTSDTKNYVLFVKTKQNGSAGVGFNRALDIDVEFNWWVIDTGQ